MTKEEAIAFFGGVGELAEAVRVTGSAVSQWPDELTGALQDRVLGACTRLRKEVPESWLSEGSKDAA